MDVKEEKPMEKTIPVFTVLKKGAILMVLFVTNSRSEEEQILQVGRHPCCDIPLTHRSISSYHLQIRSLPSDQKLFATDLSSRRKAVLIVSSGISLLSFWNLYVYMCFNWFRAWDMG